MRQPETFYVITSDNWRGKVLESVASPAGGGNEQLLVQFENGQKVLIPDELLSTRSDGHYNLPLTRTDIEAIANNEQNEENKLVIPVITEKLIVQKRKVNAGGVRIHKTVQEREEVVDIPLLHEEVEVERIAINQLADEQVKTRYEGETLIIPILEEVVVVEKRLMLREELRITRKQQTVSKPQTVTLRTEEVNLERIEPVAQSSTGLDQNA